MVKIETVGRYTDDVIITLSSRHLGLAALLRSRGKK